MPIPSLFRLLRLALQHHQQRRDYRHLLKLDEHLLADIGLTREQIQRELAKPFSAGLRLNLRCSQMLSQRHTALDTRH
ncbi:Uncharacterized conserved protein YjiS, DUF1127 family [Halopseudomonas sabulinigri]|uniref:Uncharacterized conserved protein YjiS, DUF1127 family n=1 Tax=Halopseudomonas sabulinigri TaxID=472181 RepID=A0A1H1PG40_9GAMM|nr:DUF1127 domain-containing protein [Halopseudomonas sabulinigri]SDS09619.1 Uncharacterized conserved protein YjiS, DUF1127 family [Halopseudomonas sabulinigri]